MCNKWRGGIVCVTVPLPLFIQCGVILADKLGNIGAGGACCGIVGLNMAGDSGIKNVALLSHKIGVSF